MDQAVPRQNIDERGKGRSSAQIYFFLRTDLKSALAPPQGGFTSLLMMQDWANWAIDTARRRGASYADARVMDIRHRERFRTKNGEVGTLSESESLGIGIRVVAGGAWGFASTDRLTREGVQACAAEAVAIAKASAMANRENVSLAPEKAYVDTWQNPFLKDPFQIPVERQIDVLLAADKAMLRVKGITLAEGSMSYSNASSSFSFRASAPRFIR